MLRTAGPEKYDQWVSHEIPFDSPEVKEAFDKFAEVALKDGAVAGGRQAIVSTPFGDAPNPMFKDPPGCWLHRQGNFITGFFPDAIQTDLAANVGVAYFPTVEGGYDGKPLLGGGDVAAVFDDSKDDAATIATLKFLTLRQVRRPVGEGRRLALAAQDLRQLAVPRRDDPEDRRSSRRRPTSSGSTPPT